MILHLDKCMTPTKRVEKAAPRYTIAHNDPPPASNELVHELVSKMKKEIRGEVSETTTQDPAEIKKILDQQFPIKKEGI